MEREIEEMVNWVDSGNDSRVERPLLYTTTEPSAPLPYIASITPNFNQKSIQQNLVIDNEYQAKLKEYSQLHLKQQEIDEQERIIHRYEELQFHNESALQTIKSQEKMLEIKSDLTMQRGQVTLTTEAIIKQKDIQINEISKEIDKTEKVCKTLLHLMIQSSQTGKIPENFLSRLHIIDNAVESLVTPSLDETKSSLLSLQAKLQIFEAEVTRCNTQLEMETKNFEQLKKEQVTQNQQRKEQESQIKLQKKKEEENRRRMEYEEREKNLIQRKKQELEELKKLQNAAELKQEKKTNSSNIWGVFEEEDERRLDESNKSGNSMQNSGNYARNNSNNNNSSNNINNNNNDFEDVFAEAEENQNLNNSNNNMMRSNDNNNNYNHNIGKSNNDNNRYNDMNDDKLIFLSQEESDEFIKKTTKREEKEVNASMNKFMEELERENNPKQSPRELDDHQISSAVKSKIKQNFKLNFHFGKDAKNLNNNNNNNNNNENVVVETSENTKGGITTTTTTSNVKVFSFGIGSHKQNPPPVEKKSKAPKVDEPFPNSSAPELLRIVVHNVEITSKSLELQEIDPKCKLNFGTIKKSTFPLSKYTDNVFHETFLFHSNDKDVKKNRTNEIIFSFSNAQKQKKTIKISKGAGDSLGRGSIFINHFKLHNTITKKVSLRNKLGERTAKLFITIQRTTRALSVGAVITGVSPPRKIFTRQAILLENHQKKDSNKEGDMIIRGKADVLANPLQMAADRFPVIDLNEVAQLLEEGKFPLGNNWKNSKEQTFLHLMVEHQNVDLVLKLAESIDLNAKDRHGSTPLHYAALIGNREIARILIQAGARINPQENIFMTTPLHIAATYGHLEIVELLLENNANVDDQDREGGTSLMKASFCGHIDIVKALVKAKSIVDAEDKEGFTPLLHSLTGGHNRIASFLLGVGARIESSIEGESPLFLTLINNNQNLFNSFAQKIVVGQEKSGRHKQSLLHRVIMHFEEEESNNLVQKLLSHESIDINIKNRMGQPVLFYAAHFQRLQVISWLKQKSVDLYAKDRCNNNILHYTSSTTIMSVIIEWMKQLKPLNDSTPNYIEAYVNMQNTQGNTPLHCAYSFSQGVNNNNQGVIDILKANGADEMIKNKNGNVPSQMTYTVKKKLFPFYNADEEAPHCCGLLIGRVQGNSSDLSPWKMI